MRMNRIARRSTAVIILAVIMVSGLSFFLVEYFMYADQWVISKGSPHVYDGSNIGCGIVTDRDGILLLDDRNERVFSEDQKIRMSTIHWVGDRYGYIQAPAVAHYAKEMAGFDPIGGLYSYSGVGQATLSLSARLQVAAMEALGDRKGSIAIMDYRTGQILCAVSSPTYDPDDPPEITEENQDIWEGVYLNRFTQSVYVPGSIFKIVTAAAALERIDGILDQTFHCTGEYDLSTGSVTCEHAHGTLDFYGAMANSCNCAFASVVEQMGAQALKEQVDRYSVTEPVSFDGITTAAGRFDITDASLDQVAWSGIGQHKDQINLCSYLTFVSAIANGGAAQQPYVVSQVTCGGEVTYQAQTQTMDRVMPEEVALELQKMMRSNVEVKYGVDKFPEGMTVCAKTGTAQADGKASNALLTGFVLEEEYPLSFIIVVEEGGYGQNTCVPIISQLLEVCKEVI